ncbi:hypothetical protein TNCV_5132291 [Trichonephila clavipes]|nr:hypothetical protein TNCV_5132291 [Trichonephila clavipes]
MAPFRLQPVKLLQVFGKLVRFYHGAIRNILVHFLMQEVGKCSIVVEFRQRFQGHGSRKKFCCSVPLTTMRPIWLNLPLTQKSRYSTGLGNGACTRRLCSWIAFRGGEPSMIHRDRWGSWQWRV